MFVLGSPRFEVFLSAISLPALSEHAFAAFLEDFPAASAREFRGFEPATVRGAGVAWDKLLDSCSTGPGSSVSGGDGVHFR